MTFKEMFKTDNQPLECLHEMFGTAFADLKRVSKRGDCLLERWPYEQIRATCIMVLRNRIETVDSGDWVDLGIFTIERLSSELECREHELIPLLEAISLDLMIPYELELNTNMCSCCEHIDLIDLRIKRHTSAQSKCSQYLDRVDIEHKMLF